MRPLLRIPIILAVPIILIVLAVRIVALPWYPAWAYSRSDFPPDPYEMPPAERLRLAQASIDFLNAPHDRQRLAVLQLSDGAPAFNERELQHMDDVKQVFDGITGAGIIALLVAAAAGFYLARQTGVGALWGAVSDGALAGLFLLLVIAVWMLLGWEAFFTGFHALFFEGSTWIFPYSDTLIRLFPQPFWQGAGMLVAAGVGGISFAIALMGRMLQRRWEWKQKA